MRNYEIIIRNYKNKCSLGHEHNIKVSYNTNEEIFTISKEKPVTEKDIAEEEKDITQILKEKKCAFCDKEVKREKLAGFDHEGHNPWDDDKKPIDKKCWEENKERIEYKDEYYTSLEDYWKTMRIKGDEELKNCPALIGYPKKGEITNERKIRIEEAEKYKEKWGYEPQYFNLKHPEPIKCADCQKHLIYNGDINYFYIEIRKDENHLCYDCYWRRLNTEDPLITNDYNKYHNFYNESIPTTEEEWKKKFEKSKNTTNFFFNDFDLQIIDKFKQEVDIEGFQKRKQTYGQISDEQKFFVLEHLCWLRDNKTHREDESWEKFQTVIEKIRDIYRNEQSNYDKNKKR